VLLRLAYLAATNIFALLRLLPMSDRDKEIEILVLRHQLLVLGAPGRQAQVHRYRPRYSCWPSPPPAEGGATPAPAAIVVSMTAAATNPFAASPVPVLPPDTTPTAIRDALIDEERVAFERAYQEAMAEATHTLDLTKVLDVLRNYHRIAWLTQRQGPEAHRRMLAQVAHTLQTGEAPPGGVSAEEVKALIQKRLGQ
jgi:hypothetical protein